MWVAWCYRYITSEHAKHIQSKDDEIKRLVEEKKELQSLFMKRLRSTEPGGDRRREPGKKKDEKAKEEPPRDAATGGEPTPVPTP